MATTRAAKHAQRQRREDHRRRRRARAAAFAAQHRHGVTGQLAAGITLALAASAHAGGIVADGATRTTVSQNGATTTVNTATVVGANAFNSFSQFTVSRGQTVNLNLPSGTANLVNLVRGAPTVINGVVNAYKNNQIGGNVYFADSDGIVIGKTGVVNVGALNLATPTKAFTNSFFNADGTPSAQATAALLQGTAPVNPNATISVKGQINATGDITVTAGRVKVKGTVLSGATFAPGAPDLDQVVNVDGLQLGSGVKVAGGKISITADGDVDVTGTIASDGVSNAGAGSVAITAGRDVKVAGNAVISASGQGINSSGGSVVVRAARNAQLSGNARLAANAGAVSGDGGRVEFSATGKVTLAGGSMTAGAPHGKAGQVSVDPSSLEISSSYASGGTNYSMTADQSITVDAGVTISTQQGSGSGQSGDIDLSAPSITVNGKLDASAQNGNETAGNVNLTATNDDNRSGHGILTANTSNGNIDNNTPTASSITLAQGAEIDGGAVSLLASSTYKVDAGVADTTSSVSVSGKIVANSIAIGAYAESDTTGTVNLLDGSAHGFNIPLINYNLATPGVGYMRANASASVAINNGASLTAPGSGGIALDSATSTTADSSNNNFDLLGAVIGVTNASATTTVADNATLSASNGLVAVVAHNTVVANETAQVNSQVNTLGAITLAITDASVNANATVYSGAIVNAANLDVVARNDDSFQTISTVAAGGQGAFGLTIAIASIDTSATAILGANLGNGSSATQPGAVLVEADDVTSTDLTQAAIQLGGAVGFINPQTVLNDPVDGILGGIVGTLWDSLPGLGSGNQSTSTSRIGSTITVSVVKHSSEAGIEGIADPDTSNAPSTAPKITATGSVAVLASTYDGGVGSIAHSDEASTAANPDKTNQSSSTSVSASIPIGIYTDNSLAFVGSNVSVTAPDIGVGSNFVLPIPTGDTSAYWTDHSGFKDILNFILSAPDPINYFTTYVESQSSSTNTNVAANISYFQVNTTTAAWIGSGATLNSTGGSPNWQTSVDDAANLSAAPIADLASFGSGVDPQTQTWSQAVTVEGSTAITTINIAGSLQFLTQGSGGSGKQTGSTVGGTLDMVNYNSDTVAGIDSGATVDSTSGVAVDGSSTDLLVSVNPSAGVGGSFGLSGIVAFTRLNTTTEASVSNRATVAAPVLDINGQQNLSIWTAAGDLSETSGSTIGITVAVSDLSTMTDAFIGDNSADAAVVTGLDSGATGASSATSGAVNVGTLDIASNTQGSTGALSVAGSISDSAQGGGIFGKFNAGLNSLETKLDKNVTGFQNAIGKAFTARLAKLATFLHLKSADAKAGSGAGSNKTQGADGAKTPSGNAPTTQAQQGQGGETQQPPNGQQQGNAATQDAQNNTDANQAQSQANSNNPLSSSEPGSQLGVAGSASIALNSLDTSAYINGATIGHYNGSGNVAIAVDATRSTALYSLSGAASATLGGFTTNKANGNAIGGAFAFDLENNYTSAIIDNSTITNAGAVSVDALSGGYTADVGLGITENRDAGGNAVGASVTLGIVEDADDADIVNSTISGASNAAVQVLGYSNEYLGIGGGALAFSRGLGGQSVGVTLAIAIVGDDTTDTDPITGLPLESIGAHIINSTVNAGSVSVAAQAPARVVAGAAAIAAETSSGQGAGNSGNAGAFTGSFAYADLNRTINATIEGSTITAQGSGGVTVASNDSDNAALDATVGGGGTPNTLIDFSGAAAGANSAGAADLIVAGSIDGARGNSAGLSFAGGDINDTFGAEITNASVASLNGPVTVAANTDAQILAVSVGVALSTAGQGASSFAGMGSATINVLNDTVAATIGGPDAGDAVTLAAPSVAVTAQNDAAIIAFAGNVSAKIGKGASVGIAIGVNDIGDTTGAGVANTDFTNGNPSTLGIQALDNSQIQSWATSGALSTGGTGVDASMTINVVGDNTNAWLADDTTLSDNAATVGIAASNGSLIQSLAGSIAVGLGGGTGVGAAVAINEIGNVTDAAVYGAGGSAPNLSLGELQVTSVSDAAIDTIAVGVAVSGGSFGGAGSITTNLISSDTTASIGGGATVLAQDNVVDQATDTDTILVAAGAVGVSKSVGIGLAVEVNDIASQTAAWIGDANSTTTVTALGNGTGDQVANGQLATPLDATDIVCLATCSDTTSAYMAQMVNSPNGNDPVGELKAIGEGSQTIHGVAVDAASAENVAALAVAVGASTSAAISADVTANVLSGDTSALIDNAKIDPTQGGANAGVTVLASSHTFAANFATGVAGSGSFAGAGAIAVDDFTRFTDAAIANSTIGSLTNPAGAVTVDSDATQNALSVVLGFSGSGGFSLAGSVVIDTLGAITIADIDGGAAAAGSVAVAANSFNATGAVVGAAAISGDGAVGAAVYSVSLTGNTEAYVGDQSDIRANRTPQATTVDASGNVTVDSAETDKMSALAISGAGSGYAGVAGNVESVVAASTVVAGVYGATIGANDAPNAVSVDANESILANPSGGALGIGIAGAGVGASVDLTTLETTVGAEMLDDQVTAGMVSVTAEASKSVDEIAVTAGAGFATGISGSIGVIELGSGQLSDSKSGDSSQEWGGTLGLLDQLVAVNYSANDASLNASDQSNVNAGASGSIPDAVKKAKIDGTTAQIIGGKVTATGSLTVKATDTTSTKMFLGALAGGTVGVGASVGFTRLDDTVTALVNATVLAPAITIDAIAQDGAGHAAEIDSYDGAAGLVGIGAAISDTVDNNTLLAGLSGTAFGNGTGSISIGANDSTSMLMNAGDPCAENGGVCPGNITVGGGVVGISVAYASRTSSVTAEIANNASVLNYDGIAVTASTSGAIAATSVAAGGGIVFAANGADANAFDTATVTAEVGSGVAVAVGTGGLDVSATDTPQTSAQALGLAFSGSVGIGASVATAEAASTISATVGAGTVFGIGSGPLTVSASGDQNGSTPTASASAVAATGGSLFGANATVAIATDSVTADASIANNVALPDGNVTVAASNTSAQTSDATGVAFGLVALGADISESDASSNVAASIGNGVSSNTWRTGALTVTAISSDNDRPSATAGTGGLVAGSAAVATDADNSNTDVTIGGDTVIYGDGAITLTAQHTALYSPYVDSTQAAIAGFSGAFANSTISSNTQINLDAGSAIYGASATVLAENDETKFSNGGNAGVIGGSGGVISGNAVESDVSSNETAAITIAGLLDVIGDPGNSPGNLTINAHNNLNTFDFATLKVIAVFGGPYASSQSSFAENNNVTVAGTGAVESVGSLGIGAYSTDSAATSAGVSMTGLAGVGGGTTVTSVIAHQNVDIQSGAQVLSFGNLSLNAGASADGAFKNAVAASANTSVDEWTASILPAALTANATADSENALTIASGATVASALNVSLASDQGIVLANGQGTAQNILLALLGQEQKAGSSTNSGSGDMTIDGTVVAGVDNNEQVLYDGTNLTLGSGSIALNIPYFNDVSATVQGVNLSQIFSNGITNLQTQLANTDCVAQPDACQALSSQISLAQSIQANVPNGTVQSLIVNNIFAGGGDISLDAKSLGGSGHLSAFGVPTVVIQNSSTDYLLVDRITVPSVGTGQVWFTGAAKVILSGTDASGHANTTGAGLTFDQYELALSSFFVSGAPSVPTIDVANTYNAEAPGVSTVANPPALYLLNAISNLAGNSTFLNETGDIAIFANLDSKQITMAAPNGSVFVNDPTGIYYPVSPQAEWASLTSQQSPLTPNEVMEYAVSAMVSADPNSAAVFQQILQQNPGTPMSYALTQLLINMGFAPPNGTTSSILKIDPNWQSQAGGVGPYLNSYIFQGLDGLGRSALNIVENSSCSNTNSGSNCGYGPGNNVAPGGTGYRPGEMQVWGYSVNSYQQNGDNTTDFQYTGPYQQGNGHGKSDWMSWQPYSVVNYYQTAFSAPMASGNFAGARSSSVIAGGSIGVFAKFIDIDAPITAGHYDNWSATIPNSAGVTSQINAANTAYASGGPQFTTLTGISSVNAGDQTIQASWDAKNQQIVLYNVNASGGGSVTLFGGIVNSNGLGSITVNDGLGQVQVNNQTNYAVVVRDVNAGSNAPGVVQVTDTLQPLTNQGQYQTNWYVNSPGAPVQVFNNSNGAITLDQAAYAGTIGTVNTTGTSSTASFNYQPLVGARYQWDYIYSIAQSTTIANNSTLNDWPSGPQYTVSGWDWNQSAATAPGLHYSISETVTTGNQAQNANPNTYYTQSASATATYVKANVLYSASNSNGNQGVCFDGNQDTCGYAPQGSSAPGTWTEYIPTQIQLDLTHSVRADLPIPITFSGNSIGSVAVNSVGNIVVSGRIFNPTGTVALDATGAGSTLTMASTGSVTANIYSLNAPGGIGTASQPFSVIPGSVPSSAFADTGLVPVPDPFNAQSSGDIYVNSQRDLIIGSVSGGNNVVLTAVGDITAADPSATAVQGGNVTLASTGGVIGNSGGTQALIVNAQNVNASAIGNIDLQAASGNLWLGSINSQSGNVTLNAPGGQVLASPPSAADIQAANTQATRIATALGLLDNGSHSSVAMQNAIASYNREVTANYQLYWQINQFVVPNAPSFSLGGHEEMFRTRAANILGLKAESLTSAQIDQAMQSVYNQTLTFLDTVPGLSAPALANPVANFSYSIAALDSGNPTATSIANPSNNPDAATVYQDLILGTVWEPSQLAISANAVQPNGGLPTVSASGGTITLNSGTPQQPNGTLLGPVVFNVSINGDPSTCHIGDPCAVITLPARAPSSVAQFPYTIADVEGWLRNLPSDSSLAVDWINGRTTQYTLTPWNALNVQSPIPMAINTGGDYVLRSQSTISLANFGVGGTLFAYSNANIVDGAGANNSAGTAGGVVLQAGGAIGDGSGDPLVVTTGYAVSLRAGGNIDFNAVPGDLNVGSVNTGGTANVTAPTGNILDLPDPTTGTALITGNVNLYAPNGSIGTSADPFEVTETNAQLGLFAGNGATLDSPTANLVLGPSTVTGPLNAKADDGNITSTGLLSVAGKGTFTAATGIGTPSSPLETDLPEFTAVTNTGDVDLSTAHNALADVVSTNTGSIDLTSGGTLIADQLLARAGSLVVNAASDVTLVDAESITATVNTPGNLDITNVVMTPINAAFGPNSFTAHALTTQGTVTTQDQSARLNVAVTGYLPGSLAQSLNLNLKDLGLVDITDLRTVDNSSVTTPSDQFQVDQSYVENQIIYQTANFKVLENNQSSQRRLGYDLQYYVPGKELSFGIFGHNVIGNMPPIFARPGVSYQTYGSSSGGAGNQDFSRWNFNPTHQESVQVEIELFVQYVENNFPSLGGGLFWNVFPVNLASNNVLGVAPQDNGGSTSPQD
jgi:filamentous hemagglutinin family protein